MAGPCPICEQDIANDSCASCGQELGSLYAQMTAAADFRGAAWPPAGFSSPDKLKALRVALLKQNWLEAEQEWLRLIRGHGHSTQDKLHQSQCYLYLAALLEGTGRGTEASYMRTRAEALTRKPQAGVKKAEQRVATYSFMDQIRTEEGEKHGMSDDARQRLEAQLKAEERRQKQIKVAGFTMAGFIGAPLLGLNFLLGGALGFSVGGVMTFVKK